MALSFGLSSTQAQQYSNNTHNSSVPAARTYAPPVHIAPGSATALPPNRHQFRNTPGLQLANSPQEERQATGFQDRIAQSLGSGKGQKPTRHKSARNSAPVRNELVVGSGLKQNSSGNFLPARKEPPQGPSVAYPRAKSTNQTETFAADSVSQKAPAPKRSVMEPHAFTQNSNSNSSRNDFIVQMAAVQDEELELAPVRHAFAQDYGFRNQLEEELEWIEDGEGDQPSVGTPRPPVRQQRPMPQSGPQRQTSVLRRQEELKVPDAQPQPVGDSSTRSGDFLEDIEIPIQELERQNQDRSESPRSLLEMDNALTDGAPIQDGKSTLLDRSCAEFRRDLMATTIRDIALDISPPPFNMDREATPLRRDWTDRNGQVIASGSMSDMRRGYVILDGGQKIAFARLSEADLLAVSKYWNIPRSCLFAQPGAVGRYWVPQTYSWTASSLCHKPLYFENIQLERYGHSHGPFMQPVRSVAHFFVSLAFLPYQTAIHPQNECEYPLGLYRPGDCAPWLKDPIPISLDGMRRQSLVATGAAFIP